MSKAVVENLTRGEFVSHTFDQRVKELKLLYTSWDSVELLMHLENMMPYPFRQYGKVPTVEAACQYKAVKMELMRRLRGYAASSVLIEAQQETIEQLTEQLKKKR